MNQILEKDEIYKAKILIADGVGLMMLNCNFWALNVENVLMSHSWHGLWTQLPIKIFLYDWYFNKKCIYLNHNSFTWMTKLGTFTFTPLWTMHTLAISQTEGAGSDISVAVRLVFIQWTNKTESINWSWNCLLSTHTNLCFVTNRTAF